MRTKTETGDCFCIMFVTRALNPAVRWEITGECRSIRVYHKEERREGGGLYKREGIKKDA